MRYLCRPNPQTEPSWREEDDIKKPYKPTKYNERAKGSEKEEEEGNDGLGQINNEGE